jgi:hypothetical protein
MNLHYLLKLKKNNKQKTKTDNSNGYILTTAFFNALKDYNGFDYVADEVRKRHR